VTEILEEYEGLVEADIRACLLFASRALESASFMPLAEIASVRFWVDENTGVVVARWLRSQNHEVFSVYEEARGTDDDEILQKAWDENWILISCDKDFGEKVYRERRLHHGVVLLRLEDERNANKINVLQSLLENYAGQLADSFVVVTEKQVRFARALS
jgi:predicted nuclease of predicted toxin-antitoxin system